MKPALGRRILYWVPIIVFEDDCLNEEYLITSLVSFEM